MLRRYERFIDPDTVRKWTMADRIVWNAHIDKRDALCEVSHKRAAVRKRHRSRWFKHKYRTKRRVD